MPDAPPQRDASQLAAALERLELGPEVPPPLRQAIGAALAWVDRLAEEAAGPTA